MTPHLRVAGRFAIALLAGLVVTAPPAAGWALDPNRSLAEFSVEIWRARDGLPGAWIRAITQTPDGYLWIGTQGGAVRYGGGPLLPVVPGRPFEPGADVMGLLAAHDGTVWVTPARGQPLCLRGDRMDSCLPGGAGLPTGTWADARVSDISQDDRGVVWIATDQGIFRFGAQGLGQLDPGSAWRPAAVTAIEHDASGKLWVGTTKGLFENQRQVLDQPVSDIFRSRRGHLWVAADRTLVRIAGDQIDRFGAAEGLPATRLVTVFEDQDGNVWIGSREGLIRFQPGRGFATYTSADGLPDSDVSALFEDREGSLWVGTRSGGLAQFTDRTLDRQSGPASLREHWVSTVAEDPAGVLWLGSGAGLTRYFAGLEQTFTRADGLPSNQVLALTPGQAEVLWVGTDRGLVRFRAGRAQLMPQFARAITALNPDRDARPAPDGQRALWVGAAEGLARLHPDGQVERFSLHDELKSIELGEIRSIERDDRGVVFVSANGKLLQLEGDQLRRPQPAPPFAIGKVRSITRDADGTLWLGTGDGLIRRRQGNWRLFGIEAGLGRADLFQIVSDDLGCLWAGTTNGVLRIAKASLDEVDAGRRRQIDVVTFEVADQRREVRVTRTRQPGVWKSRDGRLRFASGRGVISVDPRRLPINLLPPPVSIERALVDGRKAQRGAANHFPPGSGALEFHFAAITLIEPRKAQHRYRLEGFDPDWVVAGTRRAAYYTNIKPGRYRFRVQGSNADGVWNETGDTVELSLAPHFYQSSWFYGLVALAALALILSFHRLRVAQLRTRYAATFAERVRMARELHDSLLQGMSATLMHLRGLRKRFGPNTPPAAADTVNHEIKEIEALVSSNIEETRQLVWGLRDQEGGSNPGSPGSDLAAALTELVGRVAPPPGDVAARPEVRIVVDGAPRALSRHVRHELLRIAHEALNNAVKHGEARQVEVRLQQDDAAVKLSVSDDGRGFEAHNAAGVTTGHFGLTGMRERAAMLGQFALESRPGRGTKVEVTVSLKDLRDA